MGYVIIDGLHVVFIKGAESHLQALQHYVDNWCRRPSRCVKIIQVTGTSTLSTK